MAHCGGLYGAGSYFAAQSCKSHLYSSKNKEKSEHHVVLLCRVVMGWPCCSNHLFYGKRRPPDNSETPGKPFDSIFVKNGRTKNQKEPHHEYVVFSSAQVSVHYTIKYRLTCAFHSHILQWVCEFLKFVSFACYLATIYNTHIVDV